MNRNHFQPRRIAKSIVPTALALALAASPFAHAQLKANSPAETGAALVNPTDACAREPKFVKKFGMSARTMIDTTQAQPMGITVAEMDAKGGVTRRGQHPSWASAGYMGRILRDGEGFVYTYPVPSFSLEHNPPDKANIIYRVDSETAVMTPFVEIKSDKKPNTRNPFGLLALAIDCAQNALYAASVMGSTSSEEHGVIARIDLATREVKIVKRGVDALSLAVGAGQGARRLYVGTARDNTIVSFAIDTQGNLAESSNLEVDLDQFPTAQDKRARVLRWLPKGQLSVRAIPFDFTLAVRSSIPTGELTFSTARGSGSALKYDLISERAYDHKIDPNVIQNMQSAPLPSAVAKP
jgi:hypothetical protein